MVLTHNDQEPSKALNRSSICRYPLFIRSSTLDLSCKENFPEVKNLRPPPSGQLSDVISASSPIEITIDPDLSRPGVRAITPASITYGDVLTKDQNAEFRKVESLQPRDYAVRELLVTEETYVDTLNELEYEKVLSLQNNDERCNIFLDIHAILRLHAEFLETLREACVPLAGRSERLAHAFIQWQDRFLLYGDYCVKLQHAQAMLSHLRQTDPSFYRILSMCRRHASSLARFRLEDLIVVPFQRVLKYHLLLLNIMRYEDNNRSHSQRRKEVLQSAINAMSDVNNYINEIKRDSDNLKIINDLQDRIVDFKSNCSDDLSEYGRLLFSGLLKVKMHNQELKSRSVFLLEKAVLVCRGKGTKLGFKAVICLSQMGLEDAVEAESTNSENPYWFLLRDLDLPNICHVFHASSQTDKSQWVASLAKALINLSPEYLCSDIHKHQFIYSSTTHLGERCAVCRQYLTGIILQAYRCCLCGSQVHRECIQAIPVCMAAANLTLSSKRKGARNRLSINIDLPDLIKSNRPQWSAGRNFKPDCSRLKRFQLMQTPQVRSSLESSGGDSYASTKDLNILATEWKGRGIKLRACNCGQKADNYKCDGASRRWSMLSKSTSASEKENNYIDEVWFSDWSRKKAEAVLLREDVPDNSFLIRPRESNQTNTFNQYSMSLKHNKQVFHIKIHSRKPTEYFLTESLKFQNLQRLVTYYTVNSLEDNFPPVQSPLMYPIHAVYKAFV